MVKIGHAGWSIILVIAIVGLFLAKAFGFEFGRLSHGISWASIAATAVIGFLVGKVFGFRGYRW